MVFVGLGACTYEMIALVDRFPQLHTSAELRQFTIQGSGATANALTYLANWGEGARFIGKVGDDNRGELIMNTLNPVGVDTSLVVRQEGAVSQLGFFLGEFGTKGFQHYTTDGTVASLLPEEIDVERALEDISLLLVDSFFPEAATTLADAAKGRGVPVVFYAEHLDAEHRKIIALSDLVVTSERSAGRYIRQSTLEGICDEIIDIGAKRVAVTLGAEGVVGKDLGGQYVEKSGIDVEFVDSVGADAAFFAAAAYAQSREMSFERLISFANAAGALSCTSFGPRSKIPSIEEIEALCQEK